jgi:arginyl-tRNA synthetase
VRHAVKAPIQQLLQQALSTLSELAASLPISSDQIQVEVTKDEKFGDFSSNIAMVLAKQAKQSPRAIAEKIIQALPEDSLLQKVTIAGPGFINFFLSQDASLAVIRDALEQKEQFGRGDAGFGKKVHIEFVSANPTGPLHVGHGRGAAFGAACADLLAAVGFDVHREYYVNDAGRQMHILATSVWLRYLELSGETFSFPSNAYKGEYIKGIAEEILQEKGDTCFHVTKDVFDGVSADEDEQGGGDKEAHINDLIAKAKLLLGDELYAFIYDTAIEGILSDIKEDLSEFGVIYQNWFSERELVSNGSFEVALRQLQSEGHLYQEEGASWFRSTTFGDDKDRVLVKANGERTYFANDIAYHVDKYRRGYDRVIDVLGADHHGYVPRVKAVLEALGHNTSDFSALLVQFAILYRGKERVQMSTRSGSFVTLRELREEVGNDAARFFYVMRRNEQHLDFDLELAKSKTNENPVFYIQYAHARVSSVFRQLAEKEGVYDQALGLKHLALLCEDHEQKIIKIVSQYQACVLGAANNHEPHLLAAYLRELAAAFHAYYNAHKFLIDDDNLSNARLNLILVVQQVLRNGLTLLGVSAPETM